MQDNIKKQLATEITTYMINSVNKLSKDISKDLTNINKNTLNTNKNIFKKKVRKRIWKNLKV